MNRVARQFLLPILALLMSAPAAQNSIPAAQGTIVKAGHLLDVKSGKMLSGQAMVIEGDRILSVGSAAGAKISAPDRLSDLRDATALPGLVDAHAHLTGDLKELAEDGILVLGL